MRISKQFSDDSRAPSGVRVEEDGLRILLVADPSRVRSEIQQRLEKATACRFELVVESDLERGGSVVHSGGVDLVVLDLALAGWQRPALVDCAHELASRLPVVLLSGTPSLQGQSPLETDPSAQMQATERLELEAIDLPAVLIQTVRRARRLGTAPVSPVFYRLERTTVG